MPRELTLTAPAKLNLALSVGAKRDHDNLHEIASWMITLDFGDEVTLTELEGDRLSRYAILWHEDAKRRSDIDWNIRDDLGVRAHLAMEKHLGRTLPVQIRIEKRMPVGGGVGGGSSNAAAVLRGLNQLFELNVPIEALEAIASRIGSDVPFLVRGGSAIVTGVGETIDSMQTQPIHVVLFLPEVTCSTSSVYSEFDRAGRGRSEFTLRADDVRELGGGNDSPPRSLFNDLARAAFSVAPPLRDLADEIAQLAQSPAHVSGSGSTLFVVCDNDIHAETLAQAAQESLRIPAIAARYLAEPYADLAPTQNARV